MDVSSLFESLHGMLDENKLVPVIFIPQDILNDFGINKDDITYLEENLDIDHIYLNQEGGIYPFCYWDGLLYFPFVSIKKEVLFIGDNNKQLEIKGLRFQEEKLNKLLYNKEWEDLFSFVDKKVSFLVFEDLFDEIPEDIVKEIFLNIYQRNEYGFDRINNDIVRHVLDLETPNSYDISLADKEADREGYYRIYRGSTGRFTNVENAYSWTLDYKVAEYFATRYDFKGKIYIGKIKREDIKAYINYRNEEEVIAFFEDIIIDDEINL